MMEMKGASLGQLLLLTSLDGVRRGYVNDSKVLSKGSSCVLITDSDDKWFLTHFSRQATHNYH